MARDLCKEASTTVNLFFSPKIGRIMRYPNTRYGCPGTMEHYAQGRTIKELAKRLKRSERTVKDWMKGKKKIPFWVSEQLCLQHKEHLDMMRQIAALYFSRIPNRR